jgi:hypothetical protein
VTSELEFRMHSPLMKEMLKTPTAAELTRKLRRLRDNDIADIVIFPIGRIAGSRSRQAIVRRPKPHYLYMLAFRLETCICW